MCHSWGQLEFSHDLIEPRLVGHQFVALDDRVRKSILERAWWQGLGVRWHLLRFRIDNASLVDRDVIVIIEYLEFAVNAMVALTPNPWTSTMSKEHSKGSWFLEQGALCRADASHSKASKRCTRSAIVAFQGFVRYGHSQPTVAEIQYWRTLRREHLSPVPHQVHRIRLEKGIAPVTSQLQETYGHALGLARILCGGVLALGRRRPTIDHIKQRQHNEIA
mmetsp:Transcript_95646/g.270684  ORF Transcript_95646/g.270684 Transcript_95646/m.270684 type:complete len:220 (-) Transcript_95646:93-752(-)